MITIERARPEHIVSCTALLSRLAFPETVWLTAREGDTVIGAAGLVWQSSGDDASFPIAVEVVPDARRQGIGRALVAAARGLASGETDALHSARPLDADDPAAAFAAACGFSAWRSSFDFELPIDLIVTHLTDLLMRLRRSGRVPASARVIAARDADRFELAQLIATEFHNGPVGVYNGLAGGALDPAGRLAGSVAIVDGEALVGACLWALDRDRHAVVEVRVVSPIARRAWANAMLVEATGRAMRDAGVTAFTFGCDETNRDTISLAARGQGVRSATKTVWRQALTN